MQNFYRHLRTLALAVVFVTPTTVWSASSKHTEMAHDSATDKSQASTHDDHSRHHKMMRQRSYIVSNENYTIPNVSLLDASGSVRKLIDVMASDKPVALNFIFTTCNTICPVMTATFSQMRRQLGEEKGRKLHMVSISIDPEYDRPAVLQNYADKFDADKSWTFLTGASQDIINVMRSFNVYAGSKLNHKPVTLFKRGGTQSNWIRVDGLAGGKALAKLVSEQVLE